MALLACTEPDEVPDDTAVVPEPDPVTESGVRRHLEGLYAIAMDHGGNRAAGTSGYAASVDYVVTELAAAGLTPRVETYALTVLDVTAEPVLSVEGRAGVVDVD
jgi:hypothetical protein